MFQSFIVGEVEHLFEEVDPEDGLHRPVGTAVVHAVHGSKALLVNQGERLVSENLGPTSLQALSLLRRHQELGLPEALLRVSYSEHPPLPRPGAAPTTFYYIIPTLPQAGEGFLRTNHEMGEYDLMIRGGTIVDGTGVPRYKADLAVKDGRVAMISGVIKAGAAKELDASDCMVAPGAIDLHTHYDGQLNWDPYCTPSGWFGVTSLTIGQCGFGFAPTRPEDRDLNMQMMNLIEAIPIESMRQGMRWDWETFPEYLDSLDGQGLGLNIGALFPFSPLRGYVLGMKEARERTSVMAVELEQMKRLFYEGMQAGAFGIAGNRSAEDHPEDGRYLPSHVASDEEWLTPAEVLGEFNVGHIGWDIGNVPLFNDRPQQHVLLEKM